jgi:hypothetical protein
VVEVVGGILAHGEQILFFDEGFTGEGAEQGDEEKDNDGFHGVRAMPFARG